MAEVSGRLSRCVGVCAVSGAVAHANALTGVLNAHLDGAPMLLITGVTPLARLGRGDFQDFNPVPMANPICKYARLLDTPQRAAQIVHEALAAACSGRPGPVHLALPMDVALAEVDSAQAVRSGVQSGQVRHQPEADPALIAEAARQIKQAQRPVLVAGSGVYYAHGERTLAEFIAQQQIPTVVPIWDRGSIDQPIDAFVGIVGAASGGPSWLAEADLILLVAAESDYRVGQLSPPVLRQDAQVIRIHADEERLQRGIECGLSIHASVAKALSQLTEACARLGCPPSAEWLAEACQMRDAYRRRCLARADRLPTGINGKDVVLAIGEVLTDETILVVDGGNIGQWFHQLLTDRYPGHWLTCGASGVVGYGIPGAMAARALHANRPVILLSGDGAFTFTVGELECAARQGLSFVAVVADDEQWGISVTGHMAEYGQPLYSTLGPTRLDRVAEGLGCRGVRVTQKDKLVSALRSALCDSQRPTVIHVPIVPGSPAG